MDRDGHTMTKRRVAITLIAISLLAGLGNGRPASNADPKVSRLIDRLLHGDANEGKDAARSLIQMGRRGLPALVAALDVDTTNLPNSPGAVLSVIGDAAIPDVVNALSQRNPDVTRHNAALALDQLALGSARLSEKNRALAVSALRTALSDRSPEVEESAAEALPTYGRNAESAVCGLVGLLRGHPSAVRDAAAVAIGKIGSTACDAVAQLISTFAVDTESAGVWYNYCAASNSLAMLGAPALEGLKNELIGGVTGRARSCAADAIGEMKTGNLSAIPSLIQALEHDPQAIVQARAANALADIGVPAHDAVPALKRGLTNKDDLVRMAALEGLGNMGEYAAPVVPSMVQKLASNDFVMVREAAVDALAALGRSSRGSATLGKVLQKDAAQPLTALLDDPEPKLRTSAYISLGLIDEAVSPALLLKLRDPDLQARLAATGAIAKIVERSLEGKVETLPDSTLDRMMQITVLSMDAIKQLRPGGSNDFENLMRSLTTLRRENVRRVGEQRRVRAYLFGAASLTLGLGSTALLVSARARRRLMTLLGRRWYFAIRDCDYTVTVRHFESSIRVEVNDRTSPEPTEYVSETDAPRDWPPRIDDLLETIRPSSNVRVRVDEALFFRPWSQYIGGRWSQGVQAVIAGQVAAVSPRSRILPLYGKRVHVSILSCSDPKRGLERLQNAPLEATNISSVFQKWGAHVSELSPAVTVDFIEALRSSDIVHVAAHATLNSIEFADRASDADDLTPDVLKSMRCRMLVLSACDAGRLVAGARSTVFELIRAGTNVLAASAAVDTVVCRAFLEEMYHAMLPMRKAENVAVADAVRIASSRCATRFASFIDRDWTSTVDAFVLYGDPSLHLSFGNKLRGVVNDPL